METKLPIEVMGHLLIKDDLNNVLVDKKNAVHPQNMARIIARALSNEHNFSIHRMAFGNGGTITNAAYQITYKTPNDGQTPDVAGWQSRLYSETYSEIVDDSNVAIGSGAGAVPGSDPASIEHVSGPGVRSSELGLTSQVSIEVFLNTGEPTGQFSTDNQTPTEDTESDFTFDEIGLFTTGGPNVATAGYQEVDVGNKLASSETGLAPLTTYNYRITVDGGSQQLLSITTPASGSGTAGAFLYSDIITLLNSGGSPLVGATASISDGASVQTYGFLKFTSDSTGAASTISLLDGASGNLLFSSLTGFSAIETAVDGEAQGIQNDPVLYTTERERLLTHIIFSPVLKSANRSLSINYTLTVSVARSV